MTKHSKPGGAHLAAHEPVPSKWERQYRWKRKNPGAVKAQRLLQRAVKRGQVEKQPCAMCGSPHSEAHHLDYRRPLEVLWLCRSHHKHFHAVMGPSEGSANAE